ncbi:MAG: hypothetical protein LBD37_02975 [Treponema sp.]|jgi:exfoliative toxin A/B|nr:hypothetical protein [Treponema sp.]
MKKFWNKASAMPIGALAALMGAATLSNAWNTLGFGWVRAVTMTAAAAVWLLFLGKIIFSPGSFAAEYAKVVPASLYGAFSMLLMILMMWLHQWIPHTARYVFLAAAALHAAQILVFTFRNVLRGFKIETFLPCWFVTYNGIMVSTVVGPKHLAWAGNIILYYGLAVYALLIVCMVVRLIRASVPPQFLHTTAVVLAPVSLCLTSYLNVEPAPRIAVAFTLYGMLLLSLCYIIVNIPRYFAAAFNPAFAGLTFPMAIGTVASLRTSAWLDGEGFAALGALVKQAAGIQLWLTTGIIAFVLYNFARMGARALKS